MRSAPMFEEAPPDAVASVQRLTWVGAEATRSDDWLVREEPLEIRVHGAPVAVLMRTPGYDTALVRGFLVTEGIVGAAGDVRSIRPCSVVDDPDAEGNVVQVVLAPHVELDLARFRRNLYATSSCGICGKASIDRALAIAPPLPAPTAPTLMRRTLPSLVPQMESAQALFERTGGLHAAAAFDRTGHLLAVHEDVGRHNAVDKVVGTLAARTAATGAAEVLTVSGRVSFEIVQKALAARIPTIVAVSAPSALAVRLAEKSNLTLVAFARGDRVVVYADPGRIHDDAPTQAPQ